MSQTWNNILGHIKRNLGAPVNFLEMSDEEIIEGIKEDVLPYFSQYSPNIKYTQLDLSNRAYSATSGQNIWTYLIKIPQGERLVDIFDVYFGSQADVIMSVFQEPTDIIDRVIDSTYRDISAYVNVKNTWEFTPPNILTFDQDPGNAFVVAYNTVHVTLDTIRPDFYDTIFKKLCLGNVQQWLCARRSKYETLTTPFGEIRVNWQKLEADAEKNKTEAQTLLDTVPLDKYVEIG